MSDERRDEVIWEALDDAVEVETSPFLLGATSTISPAVFLETLRRGGFDVVPLDPSGGGV